MRPNVAASNRNRDSDPLRFLYRPEARKLRPQHADTIVRFAVALGVSTDEILGLGRSANDARAAVNRWMLRRFLETRAGCCKGARRADSDNPS